MNKLKVGASVARQMNAVVVSAGLMAKTVKVRIGVQKWNNHIGKVPTLLYPTTNGQFISPASYTHSQGKSRVRQANPTTHSTSQKTNTSWSTTHAPPSASGTSSPSQVASAPPKR